jgi:succinate dehydrogenase / fumarate reductase flavoprotein subunit/fumarate reductase flavoprotein subunit
VHSGDLTGIELMNRLLEQVLVRDIKKMSEVRGIDLLFDGNQERVIGAVLMDFNSGELIQMKARAVLLATGGGAPLYKFTPASLEKSGDGLAMGFRAGAEMIDMEMMQFHPTGLIAGDSVMTGTVLEEGLRGAGGYLLNVDGKRFMENYDPAKMERSTRDRVSRSSYMEIRAGRGTPQGGVFLDVRHLGKEFLLKSSPGMYKRCLSVGYDMATDPIQVTPTAHFQMGGIRIDPLCRTSIPGLYAAGEDAGGVHGANRLGGNGVAESIVFGGVAGEAMVNDLESQSASNNKGFGNLEEILNKLTPSQGSLNPFHLRKELGSMAWDQIGIIRSKDSLEIAQTSLDSYEEKLKGISIPEKRAGNSALHERMNLENLITVAKLISKSAALRTESRGSHYREDFPEIDQQNLYNIYLKKDIDGAIHSEKRPVKFTRRNPEQLRGETVIPKGNVNLADDSKMTSEV